MSYTITKEQIKKLSSQDQIVEEFLNEWFPEAFKTELEVGKWYKVIDNGGRFYLFNHQDNSSSYGFFRNEWSITKTWNTSYGFSSEPTEATPEEVEAALINEAKKRGFVEGAKFTGLFGDTKVLDRYDFWNQRLALNNEQRFNLSGCADGGVVYVSGKWAEILPQEKTVVPMSKALKILAEKYKVSPEQIEINP